MRITWIVGLVATALFGMSSCQSRPAYIGEIRALDSLFFAVTDAERRFDEIQQESTSEFFGSIKDDLEFIQQSYEGTMDRDRAALLADYRSITKLVKDFDRRYTRTNAEIDRTKNQLRTLQNALESGATHDSEGGEMTAEYVAKVYKQETEVASNLIVEIDKMRDRIQLAQERYRELHPDVMPILDSLYKSVNP